MNKQERDRLRVRCEKAIANPKKMCDGESLAVKEVFCTDLLALLDHIDALEGRIEAAFREGYSAGYCAGSAGVMTIKADANDCWTLSQAKAALTQAEEKGNE